MYRIGFRFKRTLSAGEESSLLALRTVGFRLLRIFAEVAAFHYIHLSYENVFKFFLFIAFMKYFLLLLLTKDFSYLARDFFSNGVTNRVFDDLVTPIGRSLIFLYIFVHDLNYSLSGPS